MSSMAVLLLLTYIRQWPGLYRIGTFTWIISANWTKPAPHRLSMEQLLSAWGTGHWRTVLGPARSVWAIGRRIRAVGTRAVAGGRGNSIPARLRIPGHCFTRPILFLTRSSREEPLICLFLRLTSK